MAHEQNVEYHDFLVLSSIWAGMWWGVLSEVLTSKTEVGARVERYKDTRLGARKYTVFER